MNVVFFFVAIFIVVCAHIIFRASLPFPIDLTLHAGVVEKERNTVHDWTLKRPDQAQNVELALLLVRSSRKEVFLPEHCF